MTSPRYRIAHPTDFTPASESAFAHALKLAILLKAELHILHVHRLGDPHSSGDHAPAVRETLARWGLLAADAPREAVEPATGVAVFKVDIRDRDASAGVQHFIARHAVDLLVLGTHSREGLDRVMHGSVAEKIAALAEAPVLLVPSEVPGFVDSETGALSLGRILVPVAADPEPAYALSILAGLTNAIGLSRDIADFIHVGTEPPRIVWGDGDKSAVVREAKGPIVETILNEADGAGLIVMPTRKRDSLLDMLRGTHTERVMRHAPCPVLAIPA
ncbi:Nucleotide-binding universal stress protein, UspA family [Kaistia soli DSM 19436]|uniref:Nucleotide-binding universal stress protein, UspA family n=1 Tax=Kaistia soli DSM 19436 TaxID=1122133 RepID=A0A1M5MEV7_9HYPH|nr:universal stress protein [Kaistia soli]SHG75898.1 Nucleotide-binding universal stress protein, UspA family [Kaistia soli DSM 19436]